MRKKLLIALFVVCSFWFFPSPASAVEQNVILERIALYIPNTVLDALDCFSASLGAGVVTQIRLMGTRLCDFGTGVNLVSAKALKGFRRQYGFAVDEGWYWSVASLGDEDYVVRESTPLVDKYIENRGGLPLVGKRLYDWRTGSRDYWAIGGALGLGIDGEVYLHPVEIADCFLGLFLIDFKGDNLTFDDFR